MRFGANLEFDVAEYSLANYCAHLAEPKRPMVALPVFTSPGVPWQLDSRSTRYCS